MPREWLTRSEAAAHAECHPHTIYDWSRAGLLLNTRTDHVPHLFLRADIVRAVREARYNELGSHGAAVTPPRSGGISTRPQVIPR